MNFMFSLNATQICTYKYSETQNWENFLSQTFQTHNTGYLWEKRWLVTDEQLEGWENYSSLSEL